MRFSYDKKKWPNQEQENRKIENSVILQTVKYKNVLKPTPGSKNQNKMCEIKTKKLESFLKTHPI